ncbi:MAG TPA: hypothetical protein V6D05_06975, partial [Stenomitos sp.]
LTILNGGSGTLYQAINARRPMILVPMHVDQEWNAYEAEHLGIARAFHRRQVIARKGLLRQTVIEILERRDQYIHKLTALAEKVGKYDAVNTIADGVELAVAAHMATGA